MYFDIKSKRSDGNYSMRFRGGKSKTLECDTYQYTDEQGSNVTIKVYDDIIVVDRKGETDLQQTFVEGESTSFIYKNASFETEMEIFTESIYKSNNGIEISYKLYNYGNEINQIKFSLKERGK